MTAIRALRGLLAIVAIFQAVPAFADNGENYVAKRYYCSSAEKTDAGDTTIDADGPSCAASRAAIQQTAGADPCSAFDQDWYLNQSKPAEEIQASGCPRE